MVVVGGGGVQVASGEVFFYGLHVVGEAAGEGFGEGHSLLYGFRLDGEEGDLFGAFAE